MAGAELDVTLHQTGGVQVIDILLSQIDRVGVASLCEHILARLDLSDRPRAVICFDNVREVSSAILGAVLKIDKQTRQNDGRLHLCGMSPNVHAVFQLTRLDSILDIYDSTEEAISNFD